MKWYAEGTPLDPDQNARIFSSNSYSFFTVYNFRKYYEGYSTPFFLHIHKNLLFEKVQKTKTPLLL